MKNTTLIAIFSIFLITSAFSQDTTTSTTGDSKFLSKRGLVIQPEAGDLGVGISANPFFNYLGDLFSDGENAAPSFGFTPQNPGRISFRYFMDEQTALRASVRIGLNSRTQKFPIAGNNNNKLTESAAHLGITLGLEKSKSIRGRIRGYYGAQAGIEKAPYIGPDRNGTQIVAGKLTFEDNDNENSNFVEKGGNTISIGVGAFVGVEYFFAPKMSLGGEFGWGAAFSKTGARKYQLGSQEEEILEGGGSSIGVDTYPSGDLSLHIYF